MADHLRQRAVRHRTFRRLEVIFDCTMRDAGLRKMKREQLGLVRVEATLIALEALCHLMVQGSAAVTQQRAVGCVLHQRMAKAVYLSRWLSLCHHELCLHKC